MTTGRIRAVFFDAAGTLFHVRGSVADIYLQYAEKYGVSRTAQLLDAVTSAFQRAFHDAPPPIFAVSDPMEIKRCERLWWFDIVHNVFYRVGMFERFDDFFDEVFEAFGGAQHWAVYADTLGTLKELKQSGLELGIISNFDTRLFGILRGLGIADLFDTITIPSLAHAAKPAARIFQLALEKHATDPEEALHIGDELEEDVHGARAAGLTGVLLDRANKHASLTELTIRNLEELPALLTKI